MADAKIIDGKTIAENLRRQITEDVSALITKGKRAPGLAVVLVGEDAASQVYVRNKTRQTTECGMISFEHRLPTNTPQSQLLGLIDELNRDSKVDGILVQLPLPDHIDAGLVIQSIDPSKDVDGFHVENVGRLAIGLECLVPCTPLGCMRLIKSHCAEIAGSRAVVVGRSNIVGKPAAQLLLSQSCTVSIAHSRTKDLPGLVAEADILVAAVGQPQMIKGEWIKPGAIVIDVGMNRIAKEEGGYRLVGDVEFEVAKERASAITPVPGGVGPMTIACLLSNTLTAYSRH